MSANRKKVTTPIETEKNSGEKSAEGETRMMDQRVLNGKLGMAILQQDRSVVFVAKEEGKPIVIDRHWAVFENLPDDDRDRLKACSIIAEFIITYRTGDARIFRPITKYDRLTGPETDWGYWAIMEWRWGQGEVEAAIDTYRSSGMTWGGSEPHAGLGLRCTPPLV